MSATAPGKPSKSDRPGAWAVAAGAAVWGLFWIPLRYLDDAGITGLWAVAMVLSAACLPAWALVTWQRELTEFRNPNCWLVGFALGLSTVLYFTGVLYSDVIRVIFLFYLLPLWTTISARLIYGEPIRHTQIAVIVAALTGVWLLLGGGTELPIPQNVGDWCGIGAGLCWGVSLSLLRGREQTPPFTTTAASMSAGLILAFVAATAIHVLNVDALNTPLLPEQSMLIGALPVALLFGMLVLFPAMLGQIWGARRLPAPTAALLTMTEIIVATASAGWLVGTDLKPVSMFGGMIIIAAVCIDLYAQRDASQASVA